MVGNNLQVVGSPPPATGDAAGGGPVHFLVPHPQQAVNRSNLTINDNLRKNRTTLRLDADKVPAARLNHLFRLADLVMAEEAVTEVILLLLLLALGVAMAVHGWVVASGALNHETIRLLATVGTMVLP